MNLSALRSPEYRLYFSGAVANINAMWVVRIIIGWLAWDLTHSPGFVGVVAAASLVPTLFFGPFFGVLIDRSDVKKAAYGTNFGIIACVAALLILQMTGAISAIGLILISLAIGVVHAAHHPVRLSLGPRLVGKQDVASVVALSALNFNLARLISPALGGLMIEALGITLSLIVTLALFLPNLAIIYRLHPRHLKAKNKEGFATAMAAGFAYVKDHPQIRTILILTAIISVALRGVLEVLPIIADGSFGRGAIGLGQLGSAVGGGALISALIKTLGPEQKSTTALSPIHLGIITLGLLALTAIGTTQIWGVAIAAAAVLGACGTYFGVTMQSLIQADLPDDMRGRVMSLWVVVGLGCTAFGSALVGAMAGLFSLPATSVWLTVITGGLVIALKLKTPR